MRWVLGVGLIAAIVAGALATPAAALDGVTRVCQFSDDRFTEISGMTYSQLHDNVIYLHNDSGGGPRIFAVDATTCVTRATLTLAGAQARDIEGIASGRDRAGRPVLFVADIGDNRGTWPEVRILQVREPAQLVDATLPVRTFRFTYPDGPVDAEAILADPAGRRVWVVSKQLAASTIFRVPLQRGVRTTARPVGSAGGLVTDGSVSPDGSRFALRDYVDAELRTGLPPGTDPQTVYLPQQPQGEALTWTADGTALLVASERDTRLLQVAVVAAPRATARATATPVPSPTPQPTQASPTPAATASAQTDDSSAGSTVVPIAAAVVLVGLAAALIASAEWRRRRGPGEGPPASGP